VLLPRDHKLLQQQVRMCGYEGVRMSVGEGVGGGVLGIIVTHPLCCTC